ncbi:MAG TPA: molybdopterin-dependent oxidoreductase, partial [bacterium]|nr:molybdopterin-dependent oxidoreductase [bacterium]
TVREMLAAARSGALRLLYVAGADPAALYPDARAWRAARERLDLLVVQDTFLTQTAAAADVVLPVLTYAERSGTVGNIEGRVQRQDQAVLGPGEARSDSAVWSGLAGRLGDPFAHSSWEDVSAEIARLVPEWAEDARIAPPALTLTSVTDGEAGTVPPEGTDGALTLVTGTKLFDRATAAARCPGIRAQAGGPFVALHPDDAARLGVTDGSLCEVRGAHGVLRIAARAWAGLHPGHAYVPSGYDAAPVATLLDETGPTRVTVRALVTAGR